MQCIHINKRDRGDAGKSSLLHIVFTAEAQLCAKLSLYVNYNGSVWETGGKRKREHAIRTQYINLHACNEIATHTLCIPTYERKAQSSLHKCRGC
ncbi:hypothetical protein POVWA2_013660 [Plasmodium ovale wallikeri]|uniref:Uncharacterized protein n=1 Tax=Plasmodium ovale wallikeri TaxID=864142 RepID=A0A1A8YNP6_PLAOA|nr:hypothetical protein POVWA1_013450 [Plasmodium ovale wallikeri]SBT33218.1 hypothetical protein POVWA2_013660 [Plasmodium ovale wallikeri]